MFKSVLRSLDQVLFNGFTQRTHYRKWLAKQVGELQSSLDYRFVVHHHKNRRDRLAALFEQYGSDKGEIEPTGHPYKWVAHTYADLYSRLFAHCRLGVQKVFECGLGTNTENIVSSMGASGRPGASLRAWRDFFPNATVIGADIDRNILFEEDRILTFYVDQTDQSAIAEMWRQISLKDFDLMIDDGLHTFDAGICLFENSISMLSSWGMYVIEDVEMPDLLRYKQFFDRTDYSVDYINMYRPNHDLVDNSLVIVRY